MEEKEPAALFAGHEHWKSFGPSLDSGPGQWMEYILPLEERKPDTSSGDVPLSCNCYL